MGIKKRILLKLEKGKQVYVNPAGREINSVMWMNPPQHKHHLFANYAGIR